MVHDILFFKFESILHCTILIDCCRLGGGIFGDTYMAEWTGMKVAVKRITLSVHKSQINTENIKGLQEQVRYLR